MPSDKARAALGDMAYHLDLIDEFVEKLGYEAFEADRRTLYAVIRCLEIISEASRRLPADMKARHASIAWKDMAGAGNIYRHEYEEVSARQVWETIGTDLPPLKVVVAQELEKMAGSD